MFANDVCISIRMILDNQRMEPLSIQQYRQKNFCQADPNCQETDEKTEKRCCLLVPEIPDQSEIFLSVYPLITGGISVSVLIMNRLPVRQQQTKEKHGSMTVASCCVYPLITRGISAISLI